jgi:hypothetical protein
MSAEYQALSPTTEVKGNAILAILNGIMHRDLAERILAKHGIHDVNPDYWYPEQSWLDAFSEIAGELGDSALFAIGRAVPQVMDFPRPFANATDALKTLDEVYQAHHRGKAGGYEVSFLEPNKARIASTNPRPCAYDMGFITAYIEKFNGGKKVKVVHEEDICCRKHEYHECVYIVSW